MRDESIADARDGFDEAGLGGGVADGPAKFLDRGVEAVLEVDKGTVRPELSAQFVAGDDLAGADEQEEENLKGLAMEFEAAAEFVKGARGLINGEIPKA